MATSIPGGAYQDAAGGWYDANGKALEGEARAAAQKHAAEQSKTRADADQAQLMADAQRDPIARALLAQQQIAAPIKRSVT